MVKINDKISRKLDEAESEVKKLCGISDNLYIPGENNEISDAIDIVETVVLKIISDIRILIGDDENETNSN